ncbi:hypothetical protein Nepgr_016433 [Nepenthes gracilis]|uniref:Uncharacterized protein n=1 Tax=Nepenthes gracilis TaxID=150966 RepID=A0AAD3XRB0_NEPGR|nr:hypothetical protein Nepgr_016433 [Nepenthes gracilis]
MAGFEIQVFAGVFSLGETTSSQDWAVCSRAPSMFCPSAYKLISDWAIAVAGLGSMLVFCTFNCRSSRMVQMVLVIGIADLKPVVFPSVFLWEPRFGGFKSSSLTGVDFENDDEEICWWMVAISLGPAVYFGAAGMHFGLVCWHFAFRFPSLSSARSRMPPPCDDVDNAISVLCPF